METSPKNGYWMILKIMYPNDSNATWIYLDLFGSFGAIWLLVADIHFQIVMTLRHVAAVFSQKSRFIMMEFTILMYEQSEKRCKRYDVLLYIIED